MLVKTLARIDSEWAFGVIVAIFFAFFIAVAVLAGIAGNENRAAKIESAREQGRQAFVAGVSAAANPHQGENEYLASIWLDGYLKASSGGE